MDTLSLSYVELAEKLGVKVESAKKLARRKGWRRFQANDRTVRVSVPLSALPSAGQKGGKKSDLSASLSVADSPPSDLLAEMELLRAELLAAQAMQSLLSRELDDMRGDRDAWREQAEALLRAANAQPYLLAAVQRLLQKATEKVLAVQERLKQSR